jgi:hypothetical protein
MGASHTDTSRSTDPLVVPDLGVHHYLYDQLTAWRLFKTGNHIYVTNGFDRDYCHKSSRAWIDQAKGLRYRRQLQLVRAMLTC